MHLRFVTASAIAVVVTVALLTGSGLGSSAAAARGAGEESGRSGSRDPRPVRSGGDQVRVGRAGRGRPHLRNLGRPVG